MEYTSNSLDVPSDDRFRVVQSFAWISYILTNSRLTDNPPPGIHWNPVMVCTGMKDRMSSSWRCCAISTRTNVHGLLRHIGLLNSCIRPNEVTQIVYSTPALWASTYRSIDVRRHQFWWVQVILLLEDPLSLLTLSATFREWCFRRVAFMCTACCLLPALKRSAGC